jgi:hypothetical protein
VLAAVQAGNGAKAQRASLALIASADRDIDEVLATRKRHQVLKPAAQRGRGA